MAKDEDKKYFWQEQGIDPKEVQRILGLISSPYASVPPPFCYPGTLLDWDEATRVWAGDFLAKHVNNIGTHTHGEDGEGGFDVTQNIEAMAIWMIASVLCDRDMPVNKLVDGYFCGGATEANDEGLWIGRQWLRQHPDPANKGIVVLCTPAVHFSIQKACAKLDIGQSTRVSCWNCRRDHRFVPDPSGAGVTLVGMDAEGAMDIRELERVFKSKYDEGFRRFLIVATVGTTALGSVDPVCRIGEFIHDVERSSNAHCYLHVDAAFGGFTVPFIDPDCKFGFNVPEVMSIALDGDKMGRLPYPGGVFLCRKGLQQFVMRQVIYVRGHHDDTFCGSRTALAPVLALKQMLEGGQRAQREYVLECLAARDRLASLIVKDLTWARIITQPNAVNLLPVEFPIENGEIPRQLLEPKDVLERSGEKDIRANDGGLSPYHLRSDFFPRDPRDPLSCPRVVYKIVVMKHTIPYLERFVADLAVARRYWLEERSKL